MCDAVLRLRSHIAQVVLDVFSDLVHSPLDRVDECLVVDPIIRPRDGLLSAVLDFAPPVSCKRVQVPMSP
jgi:hypothetical protein